MAMKQLACRAAPLASAQNEFIVEQFWSYKVGEYARSGAVMLCGEEFGLLVFPAGTKSSTEASSGQPKSMSAFIEIRSRPFSGDGWQSQSISYEISVSNLKTGKDITKTEAFTMTKEEPDRGWTNFLDRSSITGASGWLCAGDDAMKFKFRIRWTNPPAC
mmetsp:Transcript_2219/g.8682  ORF Transcript_2219/g.8682 Transcript_2219/m.8682 type:complete len:160 (+) Transcript_2219:190-669(+)